VPEELAKISIAADVTLYDRLAESGHMSPVEHVARPMTPAELEQSEWSGISKAGSPAAS
jgi:hypothetical protein